MNEHNDTTAEKVTVITMDNPTLKDRQEQIHFMRSEEYADFLEFLMDEEIGDKEEFDKLMERFDTWNNRVIEVESETE